MMPRLACAALLSIALLLGGARASDAPAPAPAHSRKPPCARGLWKLAEETELPPPVEGEGEGLPAGTKTVAGEAVEFAGGLLRTYARMTGPCDPPAAIGVEMAIDMWDLPGPEDVSLKPPPDCYQNASLPGCFPPSDPFFLPFFEEEAPVWNPFPVAGVDWNPAGHGPDGVYTSPHFDVHFYLIPEAQVKAIAPGPCAGLDPASFARANKPVPEGCYPGGQYANMGAVVPAMGNHAINMGAPEFVAMMSGKDAVDAWNDTWIYGTYDGKVIFLEDMARQAWLQEAPSLCRPIPDRPQQYAIPGWKPATFCVISTDNATLVELRDFEWYDAGCKGDTYAPASYLSMPPGSPPLPPECKAAEPMSAAPAPAPSKMTRRRLLM